MSAYEPNSRHLQKVLIFCFNRKKSAAEAHRMLSNTYETQGNWVPYELKPRDVERVCLLVNSCLQRQRRKGFLHRIVTWVRNDNPKRRKSWGYPGNDSRRRPNRNIHGSRSCSVFGGTTSA
ncbi:mariner Mos1 transposase [Trichonephila clavipes]|nr:mariner Mos1 transposase [Trichonephila clavipes]